MRILFVEPDCLQAKVYLASLAPDHQIDWVRTAQAAINALDKNSYELIISETLIDRHNGVELLFEIRSYQDWLNIPLIYLSALPQSIFPIERKRWQDYGVMAFFPKSSTQPKQLQKFLSEGSYATP